jgi:hypothetical protein
MRAAAPFLAVILLAATSTALGQETQPDAPDLATPQSALAAYLHARQRIDIAAVNATVDIAPSYRKGYADRVINYQLWMHYLERAAIKAFGKSDALRVAGHIRSLDDQLALDLDRLKNAKLEYSDDRTQATLFLPIEKDRPAGLQIDRFNFLDVYILRKTDAGWKLDYLRTHDSLDPAKQQQYQFEEAVFPLMATAVKELADQLEKGRFKSADDLKAALDEKWKSTYDDMQKADAATTQKP